MNKKLQGKVALVTGASKGIGAAIALKLAQDGAHVVAHYSSDKEGAQKVVSEIIRQGGKAVAMQARMEHSKEIQALFSETKKAFGTLDILINNAGVYQFLPLEEITEEHYHKIFDVNVLGLLLAAKEAVKIFGNRGGNIVNIGSVAGDRPPSSRSCLWRK